MDLWRKSSDSRTLSGCNVSAVCPLFVEYALVLCVTGEYGTPFHLTIQITSVHGVCIKNYGKHMQFTIVKCKDRGTIAMQNIIIDEEFRIYLPTLDKATYEALEQSL